MCECCGNTSVRGGVSGSMSAISAALLLGSSEATVGSGVRMLQVAEGNTAGIGICVSVGSTHVPSARRRVLLDGDLSPDSLSKPLRGDQVACFKLSKSTAPITSGDAVLVMSQPLVYQATCSSFLA